MMEENRYIYSDNQWQSSFGPYLQNNLYIGEIVTDVPDPRPEGKTVQIAGPAGRFKPSFIQKSSAHNRSFPKNDRNCSGTAY